MQDFSCLKCGQIVQAERMPHSCPRCYSPASEAYVTVDRKKSVEHAFDVSGAFDGAPGWEQSLTTMELEVPDEVTSGEIDSGPTRERPRIDEGQVEEATSVPDAERGRAALSATTTQELDEEDLETEVYRRIDRVEQAGRTVPPPPPPQPAPPRSAPPQPSPPQPFPTRESPAVVSRRRAPRTRQQAPVSRAKQQAPASRRRRNSVPPTMEAEPTGKVSRRRETTRRQRRMPTARTETVTDTLRSGKRRRVLVALWVLGALVLGLAAVRLFVYPDDDPIGKAPATGTVAVLMPDVGASGPADAAAVTEPPDAARPAAPIGADQGVPAADTAARPRTPPQPTNPQPTKPQPTKPRPTRPRPTKPTKPKPTKPKPKPTKVTPKPQPKQPKVPPPSKLSPAERRAAAQALYRRGIQQLLLGQTRGAVKQFNKALATQRGFALAYRGLGLAHQKLGNKRLARAAFSRYLSLRPGAADAASIRARINALR